MYLILGASHQTRTEFEFSIKASEPCANLKAPITLMDRDPAWERTDLSCRMTRNVSTNTLCRAQRLTPRQAFIELWVALILSGMRWLQNPIYVCIYMSHFCLCSSNKQHHPTCAVLLPHPLPTHICCCSKESKQTVPSHQTMRLRHHYGMNAEAQVFLKRIHG